VQSFAGSRGAAWLIVAMAISALGALHVVILTDARIPYAMARDGVFFKFAERVNPTTHTPTGSLIFLGSIGALLALTGTYEELYSLFVFAVWIFFALTAIALLRLRKIEPHLSRPYRAWGYPWTPLISLLAAIALTVNFMKHLKKTKRPLILPINGKAEAVVQDAEAYQRLLKIAARADASEGIRQGLEDVSKGRVRPAREALEKFQRSHAIPR
jgi:amino acid transporter